jgi:8-oxo-dGTP diphosphatase
MVLNGDSATAERLGLDGVHLTSAALAAATRRPDVTLCGASCHDRAEVERAVALGLDYAFVGPVKPTPSHPGARGIGWDAFERIAQPTPLPVFALGGLTAADLATAGAHGAHGLAMIRGAWRARSVDERLQP